MEMVYDCYQLEANIVLVNKYCLDDGTVLSTDLIGCICL